MTAQDAELVAAARRVLRAETDGPDGSRRAGVAGGEPSVAAPAAGKPAGGST